jgi:hypothetical protein
MQFGIQFFPEDEADKPAAIYFRECLDIDHRRRAAGIQPPFEARRRDRNA